MTSLFESWKLFQCFQATILNNGASSTVSPSVPSTIILNNSMKTSISVSKPVSTNTVSSPNISSAVTRSRSEKSKEDLIPETVSIFLSSIWEYLEVYSCSYLFSTFCNRIFFIVFDSFLLILVCFWLTFLINRVSCRKCSISEFGFNHVLQGIKKIITGFHKWSWML